MAIKRHRVAIVFPANPQDPGGTRLEDSRFAGVAEAFTAAGAEVTGAPFANERAEEVRARLLGVDSALVWFNPIEGGRDRSVLNAVLRDVAAQGVRVSADPRVIDRIGTKEILYQTRNMGWGCDTGRYASLEAMRSELPSRLAQGARVLKQVRGQSGDGVWKVELATPGAERAAASGSTALLVRHAKRGSIEERVSLDDFLALCRPYFAASGCMIDQPYQARLADGMVRCYVVGGTVQGFGEQRINALYPPPPGGSAQDAPQPGPRLYFPPDRADFQPLKAKLEREWIPQMCRETGLDRSELPVLWDADFLFGEKGADGRDHYVLCEINVSSVHPFPPSALVPLVAETLARCGGDD